MLVAGPAAHAQLPTGGGGGSEDALPARPHDFVAAIQRLRGFQATSSINSCLSVISGLRYVSPGASAFAVASSVSCHHSVPCLLSHCIQSLICSCFSPCVSLSASTSQFPVNSGLRAGLVKKECTTTSLQVYNLAVVTTPVLVAYPSTVDQVSKIVKCAKQFGKQAVPRSGGHSYEGALRRDQKLVLRATV